MEEYKKRLLREYMKLVTRVNALSEMLYADSKTELPFKLNCSIELLERQRGAMVDYMNVLEERISIEIIGECDEDV